MINLKKKLKRLKNFIVLKKDIFTVNRLKKNINSNYDK